MALCKVYIDIKPRSLHQAKYEKISIIDNSCHDSSPCQDDKIGKVKKLEKYNASKNNDNNENRL